MEGHRVTATLTNADPAATKIDRHTAGTREQVV
jgi:hypothetical protein